MTSCCCQQQTTKWGMLTLTELILKTYVLHVAEDWDGHAMSWMGEERCVQGFGGETWRKEILEHLGVDGRVILKWILHNSIKRTWIVLVWLRKGASGGICECGNRIPGSIKWGEFLEELLWFFGMSKINKYTVYT